MMSFEEKYNSHKKTDRFSAPEGYVDDIAGRISEKISGRRTVPAFRVWSISLSAVAVLALGWFLYPVLSPSPKTEQPALAHSGTVEQSFSAIPVTLDDQPLFVSGTTDTGAKTIAKNETPPHAVTANDLSKEDIVEYLLDEGFEEI